MASPALLSRIFAVLGEEFGLFGSLVALAMIGILGYAGIRIAMRADDPFVRYAAGGVTIWFMVQALINLAVVLRLLPIAGVPLPLLSYGGSALVANLLAIGVLLACARREPEARRLLARKAMRRHQGRHDDAARADLVRDATSVCHKRGRYRR